MITHKETNVDVNEKDIAFQLMEEFKLGALKFENNPINKLLREDRPVHEKLKFIPRMLFFVLGFKDLMNLVRYENATNETELAVNAHSDGDSHHWEWYLQDLEFISGWFKNEKSIQLIKDIWDDEIFESRKTIYVFSKYIQNTEDPVARMLMVEVLEITFDRFKDAIHPVLKDEGLYDQLDYFGLKHQESEESHETGIDDDEVAHLVSQLSDDMKKEMIPIVGKLFDQMYTMTKNWAEA